MAAPARERAADLMRVGQWLERLPNDFPIPFALWETFVMPHAVTRDSKPLQGDDGDDGDDDVQLAIGQSLADQQGASIGAGSSNTNNDDNNDDSD